MKKICKAPDGDICKESCADICRGKNILGMPCASYKVTYIALQVNYNKSLFTVSAANRENKLYHKRIFKNFESACNYALKLADLF